MSSNLTVHKPYIIASLPRLAGTSEDYFVCEVYGGQTGQKKRKRSELAVGINGEGVNLYDASTSRLITSYALPPQSVFTCPPSSIRSRLSKSKVERRTYISLADSNSRIKLFHDTKEGTNGACMREISQDIEGSLSRVVFIGSTLSRNINELSEKNSEVILVKEDCEIQCYDGEDLHLKWTSPASALFWHSSLIPEDEKVEYAQLTCASSASQGILKNRNDALSIFPQEITENEFNPALLILITNSVIHARRNLHIVSLPCRQVPPDRWSKQQSVNSLVMSNLPYETASGNSYKIKNFSVHATSGIIHQLVSDVLTTYDLIDSFPREKCKLKISGAQSFLRLSRDSIMTLSEDLLAVYNPKFRSRLATLNLDTATPETLKRKRDPIEQSTASRRLLSYFPRLGLAVALIDRNLVGIQIDGQNDRLGRPTMSGLLIDSLGCSTSEQARLGLISISPPKKAREECQTLEPIQHAGSTPSSWFKTFQSLEEMFDKGQFTEETFDRYMEKYLKSCSRKSFTSTHSLDIDKRWAIYALSRIFTTSDTDNDACRLSICFYASDTFLWLLQRGYMTTINIESGLRYRGALVKSIPVGELARVVADLDPEMKLLRGLIKKNNIGAEELLHAIRILMESIELRGSDESTKGRLHKSISQLKEDSNKKKTKSSKELSGEDITFTEHRLKSRSDIRDEVLNLALSILYTYPDEVIVLALQKTYSLQTIVSMIYLLRLKLAHGGWTAKYLGSHDLDSSDENTKAPNNLIVLTSTLLNCCIDAIGTTGWLFGDAELVTGDPFEAEQLILNLKLEISAALEGIEEMVYLQSTLAGTMRYLNLIEKEMRVNGTKNSLAPVTLSLDKDITYLPLGMKTEKRISDIKINPGGEITKRTHRDLGDRKSKKVGKYSREQINV